MEKQAITTRIFLGNGGGVHSRVWCRAASDEYNFDVIGLEEARKYQRGQTITIRHLFGSGAP